MSWNFKPSRHLLKLNVYLSVMSAQSVLLLTVLILMIMTRIVVASSASQAELSFIAWGGKCRIPKPGEFLEPNEECEEAKGIHCQQFTQGEYCGCRIGSSYSYDPSSKECRRSMGQHCYFVNATEDSAVYAKLPYNVKCHENAECKKINSERLPDSSKQDSSSQQPSEDTFVCMCRQGYTVSKDMAQCHSVNSVHKSVATPGTLFLSILLLTPALLTCKIFHIS